jgi:hypothetical protein
MAIWLTRAGAHGEYEQKFIQENRIYLTWGGLDVDLSKLANRAALLSAFEERYGDAKPKRLLNWVSQVWPFAHEIKQGDVVLVPLKTQPPLWDWGPGEWLSVVRAVPYAPRQPRPADPGWQLALPFADEGELAVH